MASDRDAPEFDYDADTALVTGATGVVGSWIVDRLADDGVDVVGVDRDRPDGTRFNASFRAVDLAEQGPTAETVQEVDPDAVVHVAATSDPGEAPGTRLFENNVQSTYNTLVAAGRAGADVVWTSSQAVYGMLFAAEPWVPDSLPVTEAHPCRPEDPYGTSKACGEDVAAMVARRFDVPVATIRPSTVYAPDEYRARPKTEHYDLSSATLSGNFWSYVDVRDVARMVEAALAADLAGHEAFNCVADENYLGHPTAALIEATGHDLPADCALEGEDAALSNAKAERMLDWRPAHSWRDAEGAEPPSLGWV